MKDNSMEKAAIGELINSSTYVTIFMVNGFQMHGYISKQDDVSILVERDEGVKRNQLLYKCNISTIEF